MAHNAHILVVEADVELAQALTEELAGNAFRVSTVASAGEIDARLDVDAPDLVLLDLHVPGSDGLVLVARLVAQQAPPLLVLSRSRRRADPVLAFRLGAGDVVRYPYVPGEIAARADGLLRASGAGGRGSGTQRMEELVLDRARRIALCAGHPLDLSPHEIGLLEALMASPDRTATRRELVERVSGSGDPRTSSRRVEAEVDRLRRKLRAASPHAPEIVPVRLQGYRIVPSRAAQAA